MNRFSIKDDIVPVGEFKASLAKYLREIKKKNNSLIITQNGKAAGVLVPPAEFDELNETKLLIESISRGLSDSERGRVLSTEQMRKQLKK